MSAIACMKGIAGIDIFQELAPKHEELVKKLSQPQSLSGNSGVIIIERWLAEKTPLRPTWKEMMKVLREIGMNELAFRIEKYFGKSSENGLSLPHHTNIVLTSNCCHWT